VNPDNATQSDEETISVLFKRGLRTDGEVEVCQITQHGFGELRLTMEQAQSLLRVLQAKFNLTQAQEEIREP
jgi:hypothetical protein